MKLSGGKINDEEKTKQLMASSVSPPPQRAADSGSRHLRR